MLDGLKRLFSSGGAAQQGGLEAIVNWAETRKFTFRPLGQEEGFIIDGRVGTVPWRMEWGPSQRSYISGGELRLRAELGLGKELQVVLLNQHLQESMEKAIFEQYVEDVQTRIDNETPPEMRWLVMFPKLNEKELGRLKDRFAAISSVKSWVVAWLDGNLSAGLAVLRVDPSTPFIAVISRGRLTLRTAMAEPYLPDIEVAIRLFETAVREAQRVAGQGLPLDESLSPDD